MPAISDRYEPKRGCGFRKPGGIYLVCPSQGRGCGKFPIRLMVCPTCGSGIKPSRGWTWVDADQLAAQMECKAPPEYCASCPLNGQLGTAGLLWIGEKFYGTPDAFQAEAAEMGISRRIASVPRDFIVGETWVLLAHRKGIQKNCPECSLASTADDECPVCNDTGWVYEAAIFKAFRPVAIEYVVKGDETPDELERLEKRGFTLVRVHQVTDENQPLFAEDAQ